MAWISRARSRSVSTAPLTLATGFPAEGTCALAVLVFDCVFAGVGTSVGACEETICAPQPNTETSTAPPIMSWYFIPVSSYALKELGRETSLSPCLNQDELQLELRCNVIDAEGLILLAGVALATELGRRSSQFRVAVAGAWVVGSVDEEVGRIGSANNLATGLLASRSRVHIHHVLVMAGGAGHERDGRI